MVIITDLNCIRNWDPDMTFGSSSCPDVTMVSSGITGHPIHYSPCENNTLRWPHVSVGYLTPGICKDHGGHGSHEHQRRSWLLLGTDTDMVHRHSLGPISTMASCSSAGHPDLHDIGLPWSPDTNIVTGDHPDPGLLYSLWWDHGLCTSTQN